MQKMTKDGLVDKFVSFCGYGNIGIVCCKLFQLNVLWYALTLPKSKITNVMNWSKANFSNNKGGLNNL
jgi:hypothetical protein